MELRQIRYFVEVARRGSINKASQALNVAQPALTRHLHALEEELGAQLLIRSRQGVRLTDVGETMLQHGQVLLEDLAQMHEAIVQAKTSLVGTVRIGLVPTIAFTFTPVVLEQSILRYPNVKLHIIEAAQATLRNWLAEDQIDIAFMQEIEDGHEMRQRFVAEEDMVVVGTADLLPSGKASIGWRQVSRLPLIMTPGIADYIGGWAARQKLRLNVVHRVNSIHAVMETVRNGKFCSVVPFSVARQKSQSGELMSLVFADPPVARKLVTAYSASRPLSPSMLAVHDLLTKAVEAVNLKVRQGK